MRGERYSDRQVFREKAEHLDITFENMLGILMPSYEEEFIAPLVSIRQK